MFFWWRLTRGRCLHSCLLDLTAAFDTDDHSILLAHLQQCFGIEGSCLTWFTSYLMSRTYYHVVVDGVFTRLRSRATAVRSIHGGTDGHCCSVQNDTTRIC